MKYDKFESASKIEAAPSPNAAAKHATPEADEFGVVSAESWKDIYPNEYASYMDFLSRLFTITTSSAPDAKPSSTTY